MNEYYTSSYAYFKGGSHGKTYSECLLVLNKKYKADEAAKVYDLLSPFQSRNHLAQYDTKGGVAVSSPVYEWQFTIIGAVERALVRALDIDKAYLLLDSYLSPLEFAASCGLPLAKTKDALNVIRVNAMCWIKDGLALNSPYTSYLNEEIKECLFDGAINLVVAIGSFEESVREEWEKTHAIENAVIRHSFDPYTKGQISACFCAKQLLQDNKIAARVCQHNLLAFESTNDAQEGRLIITRTSPIDLICDRCH